MLPTAFVLDLVRRIPERIRLVLLVIFVVLVVIVSVLRIFDAPLPFDKIDQVLLLVGGYLGVQSAANVGDTALDASVDPMEDDYEVTDDPEYADHE